MVDRVSLWSGVIVVAIGVLLLLDAADALDVSPGWTAVALTAAVGGVLVVSGLANGKAERHD
jgi:hypothetical protein